MLVGWVGWWWERAQWVWTVVGFKILAKGTLSGERWTRSLGVVLDRVRCIFRYAVGSVILAVSLALCHHVKWNEGRFWVF